LRCETTVLAAANPKHGRFDPYGIIAEQIDLPPTLINRFDLIFPIKDMPDPVHDANMAGFILKLHQDVNSQKSDIQTELLRKFVAYARRNIQPRLSDESLEEIRDYYVRMRSSGIQEGQRPVIPITARQLEALVRMSEATARIRFSPVVERRDAQKAIELLDHCLTLIGLDKETGRIDIDRIATGVSASQRNLLLTVKEIIHDLEATGLREVPIEDILKAAQDKGISQEKVDEIIDKLKRSGDIFEPKHGMISRL
ncbi:MAG TPA: hypothetical protein VJK52_05880, partial [Candidatus Nanoarchaeia archaeon]|nr:hypothetical protein [Candidatus Nanoarchaeia archaeon]